MNIVICGAGEIGSHAAETLVAEPGRNVTVIDLDGARLRELSDRLDVATLEGNAAQADVLIRAGARDAHLVLAATDQDEVNLLTASVSKGVGAMKTIARVHHAAYYSQRGLEYESHLGIDLLICPEHSTAQAIARRLRNPGAVAIENFSRGRIEMQEFTVGAGGTAVGRRLIDADMPSGTRIALVRRDREAFVPEAKSVIVPGDTVILVGNAGAFEDARRRLVVDKASRRRVVVMGGPPMAVWLCRFLRDRQFSIRLFERDRARAEDLAEKLDWVTVMNADPTDRSVFEEESLAEADVFIALLDNDEANIIAGVLAKTRGVDQVITVVQKSKYLDLVYDIGIDAAFSTRQVAIQEIDAVLDERPLRHVGTLAAGQAEVYRVRVTPGAPVAGKALRDVAFSPDWVVAAIQRGPDVHVPGGEDVFDPGDVLLVVGRTGRDETLRGLLGLKA